MKNLLIYALPTLWMGCLLGQTKTGSPYSAYGLGERKMEGTLEYQQMQGVAVFADSVTVNIKNPAALSKLRITGFSIGGTYSEVFLSRTGAPIGGRGSQSALDYFVVGFPVSKKAGISFGLNPQTATSYKLGLSTIYSPTSTREDYWDGRGGLYDAFISAGYEINKNWSVGMSMIYSFGKMEHYYLINYTDIQYASTRTKISVLGGFNTVLAANYNRPIFGKYRLHTSLIYKPPIPMGSENTSQTDVGLFYNTQENISTHQTINADLSKSTEKNTDISVPNRFAFGAGLGQDSKWFLGLQGEYAQGYKFSNEFLNTKLTNPSYNLAIGGFFVPDINSFSSYWKRIVFRGGISYENQGIVIKNNEIKNFGISLGCSLPLSGFSKVVLGLEYRQRGETNFGLVREDYFSLKVGISFGDIWFIKRKYN